MSAFIKKMFAQAKKERQKIVLPESNDPRVTEAASRILSENIADIVLIGEEDKIRKITPEFSLDGAEFIDPLNFEEHEEFSQSFFQLRKRKGVSIEKARKSMKDPTYFGMMLVYKGYADGLVAGAVNTTPETLRPALQILRTAPGTKLVSAFFIMATQTDFGADGTFIFADSGLNQNPNAEELSEIAISSAETFRELFDIEPVVAMTSYSSFGSADSELVDKVVEATKLAQEKKPELLLDGELQIDAALIPEISNRKAPENKVQGKANVLIFPDLNTGNIAYKLVQYLGKAEAYGPLLQGIAKPVNDLSRGCSANDIIGVVAITAVQSQNAKK